MKGKKTMKSSILFSLVCSMLLSGCISTELVDVDKKSASKCGITITKFEDNPIFAYITYDYSQIKDFDVSKISVSLKSNNSLYVPPMNPVDPYSINYNNNIEWVYGKLQESDSVPTSLKWKMKPVTVLRNEPGFIKILAIDDIGTYVVSYNN